MENQEKRLALHARTPHYDRHGWGIFTATESLQRSTKVRIDPKFFELTADEVDKLFFFFMKTWWKLRHFQASASS